MTLSTGLLHFSSYAVLHRPGSGVTKPPKAAPPTKGDGAFAAAPAFGAGGVALVIFSRGTVDHLQAAAVAGGASGVWVQDDRGVYRLLIANGPVFVKEAFAAFFPKGFTAPTAVTLTR